jgi:flagellar motor switch protein FliN/FliY
VQSIAAARGLRPMPGLDLAVISGPLLAAEVADGTGAIAGVVGVVDDGDDADGLLGEVSAALAVEVAGTVNPMPPVGTGPELTTKITVPTTATGWADATGVVKVITVETNDRRAGQAVSGATAGAQPLAGMNPMAAAPAVGGGLDRLANVSMEVSVEIGRTRVTLADVLSFDVGATVELDRAAGAPVDIRVNDTLLAQGEVVLVDDEYAVRITAIVDPSGPLQ